MFASGHDDTGTPKDFFNKLHAEFHFGCDVAATEKNCKVWMQMGAETDAPKIPVYFGPDHKLPQYRDCLSIDWPIGAPNWLNPPYSEPEHGCKHRIERAVILDTVMKNEYVDFSKCKKKLCVKRGFHDATYRPGCIDFVRKAAEQQVRGVTTVALLAARTDTEWFHEYVWDVARNTPRYLVEVRFVRSRLKFEGHTDSAPFPSLVVIFKGFMAGKMAEMDALLNDPNS